MTPHIKIEWGKVKRTRGKVKRTRWPCNGPTPANAMFTERAINQVHISEFYKTVLFNRPYSTNENKHLPKLCAVWSCVYDVHRYFFVLSDAVEVGVWCRPTVTTVRWLRLSRPALWSLIEQFRARRPWSIGMLESWLSMSSSSSEVPASSILRIPVATTPEDVSLSQGETSRGRNHENGRRREFGRRRQHRQSGFQHTDRPRPSSPELFNKMSTAVDQAVACAPVTQRARVDPRSGQVSWVRFFGGFPHL